jgi:hypothetical protein
MGACPHLPIVIFPEHLVHLLERAITYLVGVRLKFKLDVLVQHRDAVLQQGLLALDSHFLIGVCLDEGVQEHANVSHRKHIALHLESLVM